MVRVTMRLLSIHCIAYLTNTFFQINLRSSLLITVEEKFQVALVVSAVSDLIRGLFVSVTLAHSTDDMDSLRHGIQCKEVVRAICSSTKSFGFLLTNSVIVILVFIHTLVKKFVGHQGLRSHGLSNHINLARNLKLTT